MTRCLIALAIASALALMGASPIAVAEPQPPPSSPAAVEVQANDNRHAAGLLRRGVLGLHLEIGEGAWHYESALPALPILAFAEPGGPLVTPGPLIRVREGTLIDATIRNRSGYDVTIHGFHDRSAPPTPLTVPARGTASVRFRPGPAGTYYYWGTRGSTLLDRTGLDSQLSGALIVDSPGGSTDDRVFVIGYHQDETPTGLAAWVINGRSWPDTERLAYRLREPIRWRWINATGHRHAMHLHGHYFNITSVGDNARDVRRPPGQQSTVVTQALQAGETMMMQWVPERAGNWLFHCHLLFHVMPDNRVPLPQWIEEYAALPHEQHMAGMVLGVHVDGAAVGNGPAERARAESASPGRPVTPRQITLRVGERAGVRYAVPGLSAPGLGYAIDDGAVTAPGPTLTLQRAQPMEITIVNRIAHATSVHWHGIELESYYDGVPHFGGDARMRTPYIAPGDSFVARFTPPRAGTFIYHTHFNDYAQLATGLYGALIVLEPGQALDPAVDHVFVVSRDGLDDDKDPVLVNGATQVPPVTWRAGVTHRVRIIGITPVASARVRLLRGGQPVTWRAVAKDGADLPPLAATSRPADFQLAPGETYDFAFTPDQPGELRLEVQLPERGAVPPASARVIVAP